MDQVARRLIKKEKIPHNEVYRGENGQLTRLCIQPVSFTLKRGALRADFDCNSVGRIPRHIGIPANPA